MKSEISSQPPSGEGFPARLKAWRKRMGYTQEQAGQALDVTREYISLLETETKQPGKFFLSKFDLAARKPVNLDYGPPGEERVLMAELPHSPRSALKAARQEAGMSVQELAKRLGVEVGVLQALEDGRGKLSERLAHKIVAELPALQLDDLLRGSDEPPVLDQGGTTGTAGATPNITLPPGVRGRLIPRLSMVQAGSYSIGHTDEAYTGEGVLTTIPDRKAFAVEIDGNSMAPKYNPGDFVVCSPSADPDMGKAVVVQTIDGQAFCKLWLRNRGDVMVLGSINAQHPTMEIPRSEIAWVYPVKQAIVNE